MIDEGVDPWGAQQGGPAGGPKCPKMASELHPQGSILVFLYLWNPLVDTPFLGPQFEYPKTPRLSHAESPRRVSYEISGILAQVSSGEGVDETSSLHFLN